MTKTHVITRAGTEALRIGMTQQAIEAELGEPDAAEKGYLDWHAAGVKAGVKGGVVGSLMFIGAGDPHNPGFTSFAGKTAEGIGIGSTVDAVKKAYGEPAHVYDGIFLALGYGDFETVMDVVARAVAADRYLMGEQFTAADVVIGSGLRWGMLFKMLPERPEFVAYAGRLAARPASVQAACRPGREGIQEEGLSTGGKGRRRRYCRRRAVRCENQRVRHWRKPGRRCRP